MLACDCVQCMSIFSGCMLVIVGACCSQLHLDDAKLQREWCGVWLSGETPCVGLCNHHHHLSHSALLSRWHNCFHSLFHFIVLPVYHVVVSVSVLCAFSWFCSVYPYTVKSVLTVIRIYWPSAIVSSPLQNIHYYYNLTYMPICLTGVWISFSRHSPKWRVVQYFHLASQKTTGQK
jgi:hypothetical protein